MSFRPERISRVAAALQMDEAPPERWCVQLGDRMDSNQVEGAAKEFVGRLQDGAGGLLGDTAAQARGKANQAAGQAQQYYGNAIESVADFAADQPIAAVGAAIGVGFVLGAIFARF